ncbi:MAG: ATP-dependent RecD-like DNA helicase [Myxococcales bacterium]|nr:ATP-dependent RecD-like DNA helicase [Myxococcales bacterium]
MNAGNMFEESGQVTIEGEVERVRYASDGDEFQIVVVRESARVKTVVLVRHAGLREGEHVKVTGTIRLHRGEQQLHAERIERPLPATREGLVSFLASGVLPGVREKMAQRIVETFGDETLSVLDEAPERLREIRGLGTAKLDVIRDAWGRAFGTRSVMVFLQSHGISTTWANRIVRTYGDRAVTVIREDPYQLARDIRGIGFRSADRIALRTGISADDARRVRAGLEHGLYEAELQGHLFLPSELLVQRTTEILGVTEARVEEVLKTAISAHDFVTEVNDDGQLAVYDRDCFEREDYLALWLAQLLHHTSRVPALNALELGVLESQLGYALAAGQRTALQTVAGQTLAVLTGGPGTGKTTIVRTLVSHAVQSGVRVLLAAPTGRAARRLEQSTGMTAATLHRLLAYDPQTRGFTHDESNPLEADLLIVDEASMLDAELALSLVRALRPGTSLLLVGDVEQLPSVGAGDVLHHLIESQVCAVAQLQEVYRQAAESEIVRCAHSIRRGQIPEASHSASGDFFYLRATTPESALSMVERLVMQRIPEAFSLSLPEQIQVLVPMHGGPVGTEAVNQMLQKAYNPLGETIRRGERTFRVGDRVMQTRNNYSLDVFNGDIGTLVAVLPGENKLQVKFDSRIVEYVEDAIDELDLAYAISIHKSQGSEFEAVIVLLMTHHYRLLQRNLLYTAVTRARRLLVLVGNPRAVDMAIQDIHAEPRFSRLDGRLLRYAILP